MSDVTPGRVSLIAAIVNAIGAAITAGVLSPAQGHAAATAVEADAEHHALLNRLYDERIARAQAEGAGPAAPQEGEETT